jgi:DNA-binding HxlR family transcriptional regulator
MHSTLEELPAEQHLSTVRACSIADTLELIGDRWSILAIRELFFRVHRFNDIARNTGAPRDVLAARLRKLVDVGILHKVQYSERPLRFEYRLTEAGRALSPVLLTLKEWGDTHTPDGDSGGERVRYQHSCGGEFHALVTCRECAEPLARGALKLLGP